MPYNCKLFVLKIITWSYNCLLRIISYFKLYNCVQTGLLLNRNNYLKLYNYYYLIGILETIQLCVNCLNQIGMFDKTLNKQCMQFSYLSVSNNPKWVDMQFKSINRKYFKFYLFMREWCYERLARITLQHLHRRRIVNSFYFAL